MQSLMRRAVSKGRRTLAMQLRRRPLVIDTKTPLVSFTFDDAPRSAFETGAAILEKYGARATYYVSLGLIDAHTEIGRIGDTTCLQRAVASGHELGCHTFDHLDAWHVSLRRYTRSVDANREALMRILPGARFRTFAYPKSGPTLGVKGAMARRFDCCRGGGQVGNQGITDLNALKAVFVDQRAGVDLDAARTLVEDNARVRGWLIFAGHEVAADGSEFRCTPTYLEQLVRMAVDSGAQILPVGAALDRLRSGPHLRDEADARQSSRNRSSPE